MKTSDWPGLVAAVGRKDSDCAAGFAGWAEAAAFAGVAVESVVKLAGGGLEAAISRVGSASATFAANALAIAPTIVIRFSMIPLHSVELNILWQVAAKLRAGTLHQTTAG